MGETDPNSTNSLFSKLWSKAHGSKRTTPLGESKEPVLPISNNPQPIVTRASAEHTNTSIPDIPGNNGFQSYLQRQDTGPGSSAQKYLGAPSTSAPPLENTKEGGEEPAPVKPPPPNKPKPTVRFKNACIRFVQHTKEVLFHSWLNVLLVFVPVAIAVEFAPLPAGSRDTIVFSMNAIAIIPLAGLLSYATESVASRMGDAVGALMNVTFGNATEVIVFMLVYLLPLLTFRSVTKIMLAAMGSSEYIGITDIIFDSIALTQDEIRIVQASIIGSILSNLLLILGTAFLLGGLRFREQIYNSTVTQVSTVLLSLTVMSLLLPTAFHASFANSEVADDEVLKISRGTSIILLLVYILFLLFQLKSHAYMYESMPQEVIDEESHPGVLAMLGGSGSSSNASSSSTSDSDSSGSNTTAKRIRRAFRNRRRRRSSVSSTTATPSVPSVVSSPAATDTNRNHFENFSSELQRTRNGLGQNAHVVLSGDEADTEIERNPSKQSTCIRDFGRKKGEKHDRAQNKSKKKMSKRRQAKHASQDSADMESFNEKVASLPTDKGKQPTQEERPEVRVGFSDQVEIAPSPKIPFTLRQLSRPVLPSVLTNTVFSSPPPRNNGSPAIQAADGGLHRASSLPDRLNRSVSASTRMAEATAPYPPYPGARSAAAHNDFGDEQPKQQPMSKTAAVVMLLVATALIAVCAEFLVSAMDGMIESSSVGPAFIGLIVLPIVGNAAEYVAAVTVAVKNKMDLSIGIAVGSSIQIGA